MESLTYWFNWLTTSNDMPFGNLATACIDKETDEICVCDECNPWLDYEKDIQDQETKTNTWKCRNPDCSASFTSVAKRHIRECRHCKMFQIVGM